MGIFQQKTLVASTWANPLRMLALIFQAKVAAVVFLHDWAPDERLRGEYARLQARFPGGIRRIALPDADAAWAAGGRVASR